MANPESCQCGAAPLCLCGGIEKSEERCARAEARIIELEGVIAGLRAKMEILIYPENAYKEYKAK